MDNDINEPFIQYKDNEENDFFDNEIKEKIREGFITKVYGIITYQVILTAIIVYLGIASSSFKEILLKSYSMYLLCFFVSITCILLPICVPKIYQSVPLNYIVLTIFTLAYSWDVAAITCQYTPSSVLVCLFLTLVTIVTLTVYAWRTKDDFTVVGGTLFVCLSLLIFSSLILMLIPIPFLILVYSYAGLVIFSIYLIYDTQLLCGKGRIKFSEDDYILAAINIYLDFIILFLKILSIFGQKNE
jgi:FtsH-binding integral membrane protein